MLKVDKITIPCLTAYTGRLSKDHANTHNTSSYIQESLHDKGSVVILNTKRSVHQSGFIREPNSYGGSGQRGLSKLRRKWVYPVRMQVFHGWLCRLHNSAGVVGRKRNKNNTISDHWENTRNIGWVINGQVRKKGKIHSTMDFVIFC